MSFPAWINPPQQGVNVTSYSQDQFTLGVLNTQSDGQCACNPAISSTAKLYFEFTAVSSTSGQFCLGLINQYYQQYNTRDDYNSTTQSVWVAENGAIFVNDSYSGISAPSISNGTVVAVAIDPTAQLIWFATSGTGSTPLWNNSGTANPATGTGGISISSLSGLVLVPFYSQNVGPTNTNVVTINVGGSSYTYTPPSGFGNLSNTTQWNSYSYNCSGTYTLSNSNLTATLVANGTAIPQTVFANTQSAGGKYYCELTCTASAVGETFIFGIAPLTFTGNLPGLAAVVGLVDGNIFINGTNVGSFGGQLGLSTVGMAVDFGNDEIWFRFGATGNWNNSGTANPATNTGGFSISSIAQPAAIIGGQTLAGYDLLVLNTGQASYVGTAPSGFSNWPYGITQPLIPNPPNRLPVIIAEHFTEENYPGRRALPPLRFTANPVIPFAFNSNRLRQTIATHFADDLYEGRKGRPAAFVGLPPSVPKSFPSRLPGIIADHFFDEQFAGRKLCPSQYAAAAIGVVPFPAESGRTQKIISAHFSEPDFAGRTNRPAFFLGTTLHKVRAPIINCLV